MRRFAVLLLAAAVVATGVGVGAPTSAFADESATGAAPAPKVLKRGSRGPAVKRLQRRLRVPADGVFGAKTKRAVKRFQRRRGLTIDGIAGPATLAALGVRLSSTEGDAPAAEPRRDRIARILERIAKCESGGNPRAVSRDGRYRGKYQFSRDTWRAMGGRGDPAKASERMQDRLARKLYRLRGAAPWPSCA